MNKILFVIALLGLAFSSLFVLVSIWNTKWILLEKGYYTFGALTIAVTVYLAIQFLLTFKDTTALGKLNTGIAVIFSVVAILFIMISVRNTEWILLEKGYYWMGTVFIALTSAMVSATIRAVLPDDREINKEF